LARQLPAGTAHREALPQLRDLLPGLGDPVPLRLPAESYAVGRTLADLDLRGLTGATVLAIVRDGASVTVPTGDETLRAGDILALAGLPQAIEAARALLLAGPPPDRARTSPSEPG
jgi:CPA2 family monovalent cation:H+ antiporter-2